MVQILEKVQAFLRIFAPLAVLALAILTTWGIVKWNRRLGASLKDLAENPGSFVFLIIVIALFFWIFYKYINPLLMLGVI